MTQKMPSRTSQKMPSRSSQAAAAFVGLAFVTLAFATLVTLTSTAAVPASPGARESALQYIRSQHMTKIVINTDAGSDDAMAILLALAKKRPGYPEVIAITCNHGNTNLNNVVINVLKTLRVLKLNIPVYPGAASALLRTPPGDNFFGSDGLGDVVDVSPPGVGSVQREHGAAALARLARLHAGELGVVALGPLTNLALAQRLDPAFRTNVKQMYWMGGSVEGIGNIKPGLEFNAFMDPVATYVIFNSTGPPIITMPWETCLNHGIVSKQWRLDVLGKINSTLIKFLNGIDRISLQKTSKWSACDPKTMAVVLDPTVATKAVMHNVEPIYEGAASGALMVDYKDATGAPKNAVIVTETDAEKFKEMCLDNLSQNDKHV